MSTGKPRLPSWFILILVAVGALVTAVYFGFSGSGDNAFGVQEKKVTAVTTRLKEVFPKSIINTAEGVFHFVFPFDFFGPDSPFDRELGKSWATLPLDRDETLSPPERKVAELIRLAKSLGFNLKNGKKFVVIPVLVRAGIDFQETPLKVKWEGEGNQKSLVVSLPTVRETEYVILDEYRPGNQDFPEYPMTPDQWKQLVDALEPSVELILQKRGLFEEARANAQSLFLNLFKTAGLESVQLRDD